MTGSGKAGLCIGLLEEAIMDNIPAIVVDPKGCISNLLLTFPEFRGEGFRRWINEDDARKKEATPDGFAEKTAKMWEWMPIQFSLPKQFDQQRDARDETAAACDDCQE